MARSSSTIAGGRTRAAHEREAEGGFPEGAARGQTRRLMRSFWLLCALCCALPVIASASVPHLIRYQGQAVDAKGVPLEGPHTLTFGLYDAETAGTRYWEETQKDLPIQHGYFSVLLGQVTSLDPIDWSTTLWLSVQVDNDAELAPRQHITSVPLAIRAQQAEGLTQPITPSLITPQGAGSGLDADTVDGKHASDLLDRAHHTGTQPSSTITGTFSPSTISPQGSGSGLDADTIDGQHASAFASAGHSHSIICKTWTNSGFAMGVDGLTATIPDTSYQRTSGGCGLLSSGANPVQTMVTSYPDSGNGWVCRVKDATTSCIVYVIGCKIQ